MPAAIDCESAAIISVERGFRRWGRLRVSHRTLFSRVAVTNGSVAGAAVIAESVIAEFVMADSTMERARRNQSTGLAGVAFGAFADSLARHR